MRPAEDYRIYQRNERGTAEVYLEGRIPDHLTGDMIVFTRVVREDDNLQIIPWTLADVEGRAWHISLTLPQGGLYRLETSAAPAAQGMASPEWQPRIQNVEHVGVGELFMLTGQSNMAGYGRDPAYDPPELGVHLYANNGRWRLAAHPLNDSIGTIYPENTEYPSGVSPMLAFGRAVKRALNVPVGLVQASLGGSALSQWDLEEDGMLTKGMLRRLDAVDRVGAVVWYQGCSDCDGAHASTYLQRFARTVGQWRAVMGDVPVLTVQLNRWCGEEETVGSWGRVREAQRRAAREIPGVYIVPATDLPLSDGIHNSAAGNVTLGERMAWVYLQACCGLPGISAPDIEKAEKREDGAVLVTVTAGCDLTLLTNEGEGIDAEDDQGLVPCEKVTMEGERLVLTFPRPLGEGARLHMFWRPTPPPYIPRSRHGLPMLSCYGVPIE